MKDIEFIGWSDGSTEESITITLSEDTTLEALFELIPVYTVTVTSQKEELYQVKEENTRKEQR